MADTLMTRMLSLFSNKENLLMVERADNVIIYTFIQKYTTTFKHR